MSRPSQVQRQPPRGVPSQERVCSGFKPNGESCKRIVGASQTYCYSHNPERASERKINASKAARSKPGSRVKVLDSQLAKLYEDTLSGTVDKSVAAVLTQIVYGRTRLIETERRIAD